MLTIPEPQVPSPPSGPPPKIRFRFQKMLRSRGKGSRKDWHSRTEAERKTLLLKLREYGKLTVVQFRSSAGVEFRTRNYRQLKPPSNISPDVADQKWQYFKLSGRVRLIGILVDNHFFAHAFDFDHDFK
jgi:hypothetical protein